MPRVCWNLEEWLHPHPPPCMQLKSTRVHFPDPPHSPPPFREGVSKQLSSGHDTAHQRDYVLDARFAAGSPEAKLREALDSSWALSLWIQLRSARPCCKWILKLSLS